MTTMKALKASTAAKPVTSTSCIMPTAYHCLASSRMASFSSLSVGTKSLPTEDKLYHIHSTAHFHCLLAN